MSMNMRLRVLGTLAVAGALALSASPAMAAVSSTGMPAAYTCTGGEIPSGNYSSITVTGVCDVPADAVISVSGDVNVAAGAVFDAQSAPSTITVGRDVIGAAGSLVGLGCQPQWYTGNSAHPCTVELDGHSTVVVNRDVKATGAAAVLLNGITVKRDVTLTGGGSEIPWTIKNSMIGRDLTVSGQVTEWLGALFNTIGRNATLTDITLTDTDEGTHEVYVVRNTVGRDLDCTGIATGVSGGFAPGSVNVVGRNATGQCASLI